LAVENIPAVHLDAATAPIRAVSTLKGLRADDAMIMFTRGTTGVPKMVPWTRANIASSVRAIIAGYRLGPQERLAAFEIPASFQEASALPHTAKGSLDRRAVARQFGG
jgi:acyl-CoA synthetase (AMP-forming)/AMP-acid ligase II